MILRETEIKGAYVLGPKLHVEPRGLFYESFNEKTLSSFGLPFRVDQVNVSISFRKGTIRGMHWQEKPFGQTKIVQCTAGRVLDVLVDVRPDSPSYKKHVAIELNRSNRLSVYVPEGVAHGWQALEHVSEIAYFVQGFWSKEHERGIRPDDPAAAIVWPLEPVSVCERDRTWPLFKEDNR